MVVLIFAINNRTTLGKFLLLGILWVIHTLVNRDVHLLNKDAVSRDSVPLLNVDNISNDKVSNFDGLASSIGPPVNSDHLIVDLIF